MAQDGSVARVRKTKCHGRVEEMTYREARKAAQQFLDPINDLKTGIEHREKTVNDLITNWRAAVKPNLKRSTQESYEWAFKRIEKESAVPIDEIEKADVQIFLTNAAKTLAPESTYDL